MPRSDRSFARRFNPGYHSPYNRAARSAFTRRWFGVAGRAVGGAGAVAAAGLANLFAPVPNLSSDPRVSMPRGYKRSAGSQLLPSYRAPRARGSSESDAGGYTQVQYSRDRVGKKLDKVQRMMKLIASQTTYRVERFGALSAATENESFYRLNSYYDGASPNRVTQLPLYLLNLTCMQQKDLLNGNANVPAPFQRLNFFENGDTFRWSPITGLLASSRDGVPQLTYGYEPLVTAVSPTIGGEPWDSTQKAFIGKIKLGLCLTGARKYASSIWVQIVQFTEDFLGPPLKVNAVYTGGAAPTLPGDLEAYTTATDPDQAAQHKKFWLEQTNGLLENPLTDRTTGRSGGMKVLYSKRFNYNPTLTTESDAGGHETIFKLQYHMDKMVDYQTQPDVDNIVDIDLASVMAQEVVVNFKQLYPDTVRKGRVYLMIKAAVPAVATSDPGAASYDNYPSFDLSCERVVHRLRAEATATSV